MAAPEQDEQRLVSRRPTADLSGVDTGVLAKTIVAGMKGGSYRLSCGCMPGVAMCGGQRDLAQRIVRARRRSLVRGDRGPLEEAMTEARAHWSEMEGAA